MLTPRAASLTIANARYHWQSNWQATGFRSCWGKSAKDRSRWVYFRKLVEPDIDLI